MAGQTQIPSEAKPQQAKPFIHPSLLPLVSTRVWIGIIEVPRRNFLAGGLVCDFVYTITGNFVEKLLFAAYLVNRDVCDIVHSEFGLALCSDY